MAEWFIIAFPALLSLHHFFQKSDEDSRLYPVLMDPIGYACYLFRPFPYAQ